MPAVPFYRWINQQWHQGLYLWMELEAKPICSPKCLSDQHLARPQKNRCVPFSPLSQGLSLASWKSCCKRVTQSHFLLQLTVLLASLQRLRVTRRLLTWWISSWSLSTSVARVTHGSAGDIPGLEGPLFVALKSHSGNFHNINLSFGWRQDLQSSWEACLASAVMVSAAFALAP